MDMGKVLFNISVKMMESALFTFAAVFIAVSAACLAANAALYWTGAMKKFESLIILVISLCISLAAVGLRRLMLNRYAKILM
jgi:hypothetical protein